MQLANDLGGLEVASKALMAGGAETAVDGTARLGGDAKRATILLRDEDRLDGIGLPSIEQPLPGAVGSHLIRQNGQRANLGHGGQAHSKRLGQIGHVVEIGGARLMQPLLQLGGPKGLFPNRHHPVPEGLGAEVQEVHHDRRRRTRPEGLTRGCEP